MTITRSGITALSVASVIVLKVSIVLLFRTVRTIKTIMTITRSGIIVVRGHRNCLKGLNGLLYCQSGAYVALIGEMADGTYLSVFPIRHFD